MGASGVASNWLRLRPRHRSLFTGRRGPRRAAASHLANVLAAGPAASRPPFTAARACPPKRPAIFSWLRGAEPQPEHTHARTKGSSLTERLRFEWVQISLVRSGVRTDRCGEMKGLKAS